MNSLLFTMLFFCTTISGMRAATTVDNGLKKRKFEELINFNPQEKNNIALFIKSIEGHCFIEKQFFEIDYYSASIIE